MPREEENPDRIILKDFLTCQKCGEGDRWLVQEFNEAEIAAGRMSPKSIKGVGVRHVGFKDDEWRKKKGTDGAGEQFYVLQIVEDTCVKCGHIQVIRHERLTGRYTQKATVLPQSIHLPSGGSKGFPFNQMPASN